MSAEAVDASARIDPAAVLEEGVRVGPWSVVGPNVHVGAGTVIDSHVVIRANTRIGPGNRFFQFCSVGEDPADKKYEGEETWLEIGEGNVFREGVTLHRGTGLGGGLTRIGDRNLLMAYAHAAHDCVIGDDTVLANNVGLCGHVRVDDWAIIGGFAGVNQFLRIGAHAMVGGMTHVAHDVPAYMIVGGRPAAARGVNAIGLERRGFDRKTIGAIREAYKIVYKRGHSLEEAVARIRAMSGNCRALEALAESLESSERGIVR